MLGRCTNQTMLSAYKLRHELNSRATFSIYEKSPDLGGTWFENTYPGSWFLYRRTDSRLSTLAESFVPFQDVLVMFLVTYINILLPQIRHGQSCKCHFEKRFVS